MAKSHILDLNTAKRPTLDLTLQDEARTLVHIKAPSEGLISRLRSAVASDLPQVRAQDTDSINTLYELTAELISCNRDFLEVSASDLRGKYRMDLESLVLFLSAYLDFVRDINNLKN